MAVFSNHLCLVPESSIETVGVDFNNVHARQQVDISDISQEKYTNLLEATRQKNDHAVEMLRKDMATWSQRFSTRFGNAGIEGPTL